MTDLFDTENGATPLSPEEQEGLIPSWITTRTDLNAAEEANIEDALIWLSRSRRKNLLTERFAKQLHARMFGDVWKWAGTYRTTEKNIGVAPNTITLSLIRLFDDVQYWIDNQVYDIHEISIRFHYRLVYIHP